MFLYIKRLFFFKQKTAYEMRISDWSSDVCSSDLLVEDRRRGRRIFEVGTADQRARAVGAADDDAEAAFRHLWHHPLQRAVMVEQRIAAGEQEGVGARAFEVQQQFDRLDPVDAEPPGLEDRKSVV